MIFRMWLYIAGFTVVLAMPLRAQAPPPVIFPPGAAITVETDQLDPTLSCKQLRNLPFHTNNQAAFQNLETAPSSSTTESFIVGHGEPGGLCTGDGRACYTAEKSINLYDDPFWGQYADTIKRRFTLLSLLGCNVGRFDDGVAFLKKMATVTQMPVRAPNGMVWCINDEVVLDPDVTWVEVKPDGPLAPNSGVIYTVPLRTAYLLSIDGEHKTVPVGSVEILEFQYFGLPAQRSFLADPFEAVQLLNLVDFGSPLPHEGRPLAAITGKFRLSILQDGGRRVEKRYFLYADSLVQEVDSSEPIFYKADTRIHQKLQDFLDLHLKSSH